MSGDQTKLYAAHDERIAALEKEVAELQAWCRAHQQGETHAERSTDEPAGWTDAEMDAKFDAECDKFRSPVVPQRKPRRIWVSILDVDMCGHGSWADTRQDGWSEFAEVIPGQDPEGRDVQMAREGIERHKRVSGLEDELAQAQARLRGEVKEQKLRIDSYESYWTQVAMALQLPAPFRGDIIEEAKKARQRAEAAEASCASTREALQTIKIRISFIGMPQEEFLPNVGALVGVRRTPDWRKAISAVEAALAADAGSKLLAERDELRAELATIRAAVQKMTALPNWENRFSSGWKDIDGAVRGIVEAATEPNETRVRNIPAGE